MLELASSSSTPDAASSCCTTQLPNAHNTGERRILYEYHPWVGRDVCIDRVVEKSGIRVARCSLAGDAPILPLEVPLWMFDRLACAAIRCRPSPEVDLTALSALQFLLGEVPNSDTSDHHLPSTTPDLSADLVSCDQNQGDVDAPPSHKTGPVRVVRPAARIVSVADATMAESAVPNAQRSDLARGATADGTRSPGKERTRRGSCRSTPEQGER